MKLLIFVFLISQGDYFKFSHKKHIESDVTCTTCHPKSETSLNPQDNLFPSHDECSQCHEIEENCSTCHIGEPREIEKPALYISYFPHKKHFKFDCSTCHQKIKGEDIFLSMREYAYPKMNTCITCHKENNVSVSCNLCHTDKEEKLFVFHSVKYRNLHSEEAKFEEKNCEMCHNVENEKYIGGLKIPACNTCHSKENIFFKNHPENFKFSHSFSYLSGESACSNCHNDYRDCVECHRSQKIYPFDHNSIEWVTNTGGEHAEEAETNPEKCVVCHEQKDNVCLSCHGGGK